MATSAREHVLLRHINLAETMCLRQLHALLQLGAPWVACLQASVCHQLTMLLEVLVELVLYCTLLKSFGSALTAEDAPRLSFGQWLRFISAQHASCQGHVR